MTEPSADAPALPASEPIPELMPPAAAPPRPRRFRGFALALVVLLAAGAIGFGKGVYDFRNEPKQLATRAFQDLRSADGTLRDIDAAEGSALTSRSAVPAQRAEDAIPAVRKRLDAARGLLDRAIPKLGGRERGLASAMRASAVARTSLLDAAAPLLPIDRRAAEGLGHAEAAWAQVQLAARASDLAVAAFNRHRKADVQSSTRINGQVEAALDAALAELDEAGRIMPEARSAEVRGYVQARRRLATESARIDAVWLSGNVAEANRLLGLLAAEQTKLDARSAGVRSAPTGPWLDARKRLAGKLVAVYAQTRAKAADADRRLQMLLAAPPQPST